jgi:predicted RNase H-like HicB family nuclease
MTQALQLDLWTYFERDPESRRWIARVLPLDVMSVGETLAEAIEMAEDAAAMTLEHDLANGLDPQRRRAPEEFWVKLHELLGEHKPRQLSSVVKDEEELTRVATQISIQIALADHTATEGSHNDARLVWPSAMCA